MSGDLHQLFSLMLEIGDKEAKTGRIDEREALPLHLLEKRKTQIPRLRPTFSVGVHIVHDSNRTSGFYVNTAYPRNDEPMTKKLVASPAFRSFTSFMIQDFEMFDTMDDVIRFGCQQMAYRDASYIPELKTYLKKILAPTVSDIRIGQLWNSTNAEFSGNDQTIRGFLERTLVLLEEDAPNGVLKKKPIRYRADRN